MHATERTIRKRVALEVRAEMTRKEITAQVLAQRLRWGEATLGRRLRAERPFPVEDLIALCYELRVDPTALIERAVSQQSAAA